MRRFGLAFDRPIRAATAWLLSIAVAGCTYTGSSDDPVTRKLSWFSYLNGDDIRNGCVEGTLPRYRFVYNGVYVTQVRTYDIDAGVVGSNSHRLTTRVIGPSDLSEVIITDPFETAVTDPRDLLTADRGEIVERRLSDEDLDRLDASLLKSGFFAPPPVGMLIRSEDFFWIGSACVEGRFFFNVYKWPSPEFTNADFASKLFAWDATGIPVNPPRKLTDFDIYGDNFRARDEASRFTLSVGENGLAGVRPLL